MKLGDLTEVVKNNAECVILKVKDGAEFELVCLGCFDGNEKMFRLTKGTDHTCTVWRENDKPFYWEWGESGHTLVSDNMSKMGKLIQQTIEDDFDVYVGGNADKRRDTSVGKKLHTIKAMRGAMGRCCIHKDGEFFRYFNTRAEAENHFISLGYEIVNTGGYTSGNGCDVETFNIVPKAV